MPMPMRCACDSGRSRGRRTDAPTQTTMAPHNLRIDKTKNDRHMCVVMSAYLLAEEVRHRNSLTTNTGVPIVLFVHPYPSQRRRVAAVASGVRC